MTESRRTALKQLQQMDTRIEKAKQEIGDFDPLFADVEEPALLLESELTTTRSRLQEMKLAERRVELATEEKGVRAKRLEERLGSVRNLREEAAVSAELEMVKRALQSDEQEALTLIDQIRKLEERLEEVESAYGEAQEIVEPKRQELLDQRSAAESKLEGLREERERFVEGLDPAELRMYDAIRKGGRTVAVAELTEDGACSNCYGIVPLQLQNEIRHGSALLRCEGCGVILTAPDPDAPQPEADEEPEAPVEDSAAEDAPDADDSEVDEAGADGAGDDAPEAAVDEEVAAADEGEEVAVSAGVEDGEGAAPSEEAEAEERAEG